VSTCLCTLKTILSVWRPLTHIITISYIDDNNILLLGHAVCTVCRSLSLYCWRYSSSTFNRFMFLVVVRGRVGSKDFSNRVKRTLYRDIEFNLKIEKGSKKSRWWPDGTVRFKRIAVWNKFVCTPAHAREIFWEKNTILLHYCDGFLWHSFAIRHMHI